MMVFNLHLSRATTLLGAALAAFTLSSSLALANPSEQLLTRLTKPHRATRVWWILYITSFHN